MRTHFHLYDGTAFQSSGEWKPTVDYICEGIRLQLALVAYQTKETSDKWPHLVLEVYSGKLSSKSFQQTWVDISGCTTWWQQLSIVNIDLYMEINWKYISDANIIIVSTHNPTQNH